MRTDAAAAEELEAERKRQTIASLELETVQERLGWVLLMAGATFVTGAKRLLRDRPSHGLNPEAIRSLGLQSFVCLPPEGSVAIRSRPSRDEGSSTVPTPPDANSELVRSGPRIPNEDEPAPEEDLAIVDALVMKHGTGREAAIPILQAIQEHYRYLPDVTLKRLCARTEITPAQIAGTSTFYARFRHAPIGDHLVRLCHGTACHVAGIGHVEDELRRRLAIPEGTDTDPERRFTLEPVACVGCCSLAPVMMVGDETAGHLTPATAGERLAAVLPHSHFGVTEEA